MIRLTFVTENVRGGPHLYETDDLDVAVSEFAGGHLGTMPTRSGRPLPWVFVIVVEPGDERVSREDLAAELRRIASSEETAAVLASRGAPTGGYLTEQGAERVLNEVAERHWKRTGDGRPWALLTNAQQQAVREEVAPDDSA